jgi:hypothetical protein
MCYMKNLTLILVLILATVEIANGEEAYYTWVDENGITNYAERNPEGVDATFISSSRTFGQRTLPRDPGRPQAAPAERNPVGTDPDALVNEQAAVMAAEVAAIKSQNCEIGKNNLAQIKAFSRIRVTDDKGENRILTDEEKEARAEQARQTIRENCSG